MGANWQTAVEFTRGPDHLDIWVDANDNGIRDDDDVNIFISASGSIYAASPMLKRPLDVTLQGQVRDAAMALLAGEAGIEENLRAMALQMVEKAIAPDADA